VSLLSCSVCFCLVPCSFAWLSGFSCVAFLLFCLSSSLSSSSPLFLGMGCVLLCPVPPRWSFLFPFSGLSFFAPSLRVDASSSWFLPLPPRLVPPPPPPPSFSFWLFLCPLPVHRSLTYPLVLPTALPVPFRAGCSFDRPHLCCSPGSFLARVLASDRCPPWSLCLFLECPCSSYHLGR
jgi:hypothetical protein